jgi:hypothetical protein
MPDWKTLVRERMENLGLGRAQEEEIVSELASHLEDCYEEFRTQGICKSEAVERSLEQVADWPGLLRKIKRAKRKEEMMNHRTKTLWLPALISLTAAMVFLMGSTLIALQPRFIAGRFVNVHTSTTSTNYPLAAYLPWLLLLPFCGAAGAYLSRRAGGQRLARLVAGLFPWIALFGLIGFLTLIGQIVPFQHQWVRFVTGLLLVSVPPGIALFLGAVPFLKESRSRMVAND